MRIAFFCKRRYTGKDVIGDRFGRLYEMPRFLAERGHRVRAYCLDYHSDDAGAWTHALGSGSIHWEAHPARVRRPISLARIPVRMLDAMRNYAPDVLMGASDIPSLALTAWLADRLDVPCAIDLYDNFESFGQAHIPGFRMALRAATRHASLVTTVSTPLTAHVTRRYGLQGEVITVPNGISPHMFRPMEKATARARLGLPADARLIGTAGGLSREKGVDVLYSAWQRLADHDRNVHLVLAGPLSPTAPPPVDERVHYLGNLPHEQIAALFGALDVGVVTLSDDAFGRFCFPQKAYEMLACNLAIVATDVGVMSDLLGGFPDLLYAAGDADALARSIARQLNHPVATSIPAKDWDSLLPVLEQALADIATRDSRASRRHARPY